MVRRVGIVLVFGRVFLRSADLFVHASKIKLINVMPTPSQAEDILTEFEPILQVWEDNPDFKVGKIELTAAQALNQEVDAALTLVKKKENELKGLIDDRDSVASALNELRTRALSGIRAHFGPDSTEYGRAGGTRKSERQKPQRNKKETAVK